ncbi:MAG: bifunctional phosphopantothenoylcysteine decarboxylase/phosphopantothenate--cysteine ligase CoaBC [Mycoplasmatales bacterium]
MKITLGITGSVAVIKVEELIKSLKENGHEVTVVSTKHANIFDEIKQIEKIADFYYDHKLKYDLKETVSHIDLAQKTDLVLIAPATFNFINKVANGIADDMLTTIMSAVTVPVVIAPAMNTFMWENKLLQTNLSKLQTVLNYTVIEPRVSMLACGYDGIGAMANIENIIKAVNREYKKPLYGINVVVTCGATRVFIDPIRFLSNTSSGTMGHEIAKHYAKLGASVTCICANTNFLKQGNIKYIEVSTPEQLYDKAHCAFKDSNIFIMCAAVSDYKPKNVSEKKIKKQTEDMNIQLQRSVDILESLGKIKDKQILIGFAAEDTDHLKNGESKLKRKNLDYIIINDLSAFNQDNNAVTIIDKNNISINIESNTKKKIAKEIIQVINN